MQLVSHAATLSVNFYGCEVLAIIGGEKKKKKRKYISERHFHASVNK